LRTRGLDEDPLPLFHLLPDGTFGVDYPLTGPTYAVALQAVADGPDRYCLHVIKFWHDEQGQKHQVASMIIAFPAGKEESLSWLHQLHANVADDVTHGMRELQDLWAAFNQRPGNFLTKGPPNPFDDLPVVNDAPPPPAASPPKSTVRPPEQMGQPRRNDRDLPARELPDRSTPEQDFPDLGRW